MNYQPRILRTNTGYQLGNLVATNLPTRQAQTLLLCATGKSVKEAANELNCSAKNISQLKTVLFNKFNVNSAPELVTRAFECKTLQFLNAYASLQQEASSMLREKINSKR